MRFDESVVETQITAPLAGLAAHIRNQRRAILARWRLATEEAPGLTIVSTLTRVQFNDHIPGVLDAYGRILKAWPALLQSDEKEQIIEHGLQRWQQGYQLRDLTREWGHLNISVMEELDIFALANPDVANDAMVAARKAWTKLCWDGISDSTTQYWRLSQAESAGHVHDLERALSTLNELDQTRAAAWRETAHDLQGSLSVVTLASSVLDREDLPEEARHEFSGMVRRGATSLHEMLTDFMSLARLDAGLEERRVKRFNAATLMTDFCKTSQPLAEARGLFLETQGPDSLLVEGDPSKVRRILQNLLLNALKYTERGGVTVTWKPLDDATTENWTFCVQDTGPGIDDHPEASPLANEMHDATKSAQDAGDAHPEDKSTADEAKAPTSSSRSEAQHPAHITGEGVGLSIVKRLCELLNASIELETCPGKGTTFRVILPRRYVDGTDQSPK